MLHLCDRLSVTTRKMSGDMGSDLVLHESLSIVSLVLAPVEAMIGLNVTDGVMASQAKVVAEGASLTRGWTGVARFFEAFVRIDSHMASSSAFQSDNHYNAFVVLFACFVFSGPFLLVAHNACAKLFELCSRVSAKTTAQGNNKKAEPTPWSESDTSTVVHAVFGSTLMCRCFTYFFWMHSEYEDDGEPLIGMSSGLTITLNAYFSVMLVVSTVGLVMAICRSSVSPNMRLAARAMHSIILLVLTVSLVCMLVNEPLQLYEDDTGDFDPVSYADVNKTIVGLFVGVEIICSVLYIMFLFHMGFTGGNGAPDNQPGAVGVYARGGTGHIPVQSQTDKGVALTNTACAFRIAAAYCLGVQATIGMIVIFVVPDHGMAPGSVAEVVYTAALSCFISFALALLWQCRMGFRPSVSDQKADESYFIVDELNNVLLVVVAFVAAFQAMQLSDDYYIRMIAPLVLLFMQPVHRAMAKLVSTSDHNESHSDEVLVHVVCTLVVLGAIVVAGSPVRAVNGDGYYYLWFTSQLQYEYIFVIFMVMTQFVLLVTFGAALCGTKRVKPVAVAFAYQEPAPLTKPPDVSQTIPAIFGNSTFTRTADGWVQ